MSYLSRPRIGFLATDASTNPSTANNENVIHLLDYDNVVLLNPPRVRSERHEDDTTLPEMGHAAYREWMTTLVTVGDVPNPKVPLGRGNQPTWAPQMPGYWNYWGDHMTTWGSAEVNSLWLANASPVTSKGTDPLFGARVIWHARIVDVDPADTWSTQFVASGFSIIGPDANGRLAELVRGLPTTSFTRWLNFNRVMGAGTFQSVIPTQDLHFIDDAAAPASAAFTALRDGARGGGGLLLRYCFYGMSAKHKIPAMYDDFSEGGHGNNPKIGNVLGTIGVWNGTDMYSTPVGRVMMPPASPFFPSAPQERVEGVAAVASKVRSHAHVEQLHTPGTHLHDSKQLQECIDAMGPAVAVVDGGSVVLDLLTAFPEIGCVRGVKGDPFDKHDFGPVSLWAVVADGAGTRTGGVDYSRKAYEQLGGVWEVPIADASVVDGHFQLRIDASGDVLLREIEVAQVETDDRAVYLDLAPTEGGEGMQATGEVTLKAFTRGEPITEPLEVEVQFWVDVMTPGAVNSINPLVVLACELKNDLAETGLYSVVDSTQGPSGGFEVTVPPGGVLPLKFTADRAGCVKLRFLVAGMDAATEPQFAVEYYTNVRVLPYDDYSDVPDENVTLDFVYDEVLHYYSILHPVMSDIIPWGPANTPHDPDRVAQFAALMREAIDESRLGTALQMPITRELSAGKRELLRRWCDLQLRERA